MENFSFHDIFATKGIEYLLIIGFLGILIPFWIVLNKEAKVTKQIRDSLGILSASLLRIPQGLFYGRNHTWAHLEKSGVANVGIDDLLQHLTGQVNFGSLKNPGDTIKKGELLAEIRHNNKALKIFSPVSGKIVRTNEELAENPEMFNEDPYGQAWIYKIKPSDWRAETSACLFAEDAVKWANRELENVKAFLISATARHSNEPSLLALQDGGELRSNVLSELPGEVWNDFQKEFLERP